MSSNVFRLYEAADAGPDGYPLAWHETLKHLVREQAGHRCIRCLHPYRCGEHDSGEWTRCDEKCNHGGPYRWWDPMDAAWFNGTAGKVRVGGDCPVEAQWRILTVHHLDGNKLNCRWWNLAALCQRDHLTIQGKVKLHRPWLLDHSDWFKPYAAGYYAWNLLGEDLDREATMARLDELLTLGRTRQQPQESTRA